MKRALRSVAAAALALGVVIGGASTASAEDPPVEACDTQDGEYAPDGECEIVVTPVPVCENGVPYLDYSAYVEGSSVSVLSITWHNPGGSDIVAADLPLSGRLLWPGTVLDGDGNAVDWPGWTQEIDGTWTEGDEYSWTRPTVSVTFEANPSVTTTVGYPQGPVPCDPTGGIIVSPPTEGDPDDPDPQAPTDGEPTAGELSDTGFSGAPLLGAAGGLVVAGGLLLLLGRRRSTTHDA